MGIKQADTYQGELEHRRVKRFYARTNKNKAFTQQITRQQRRERIIRKIRERLKKQDDTNVACLSRDAEILHLPVNFKGIQSPSPAVSFEESDALPQTSPEVHHHISNSTRQKENIFKWVDYHKHNGDQPVMVR